MTTATTDDLTVEVTQARTVLLVLALDTGGAPVEFSVELSAETACAFGEVLTQAGKAAAGPVNGEAAVQPGAVQRRAGGDGG